MGIGMMLIALLGIVLLIVLIVWLVRQTRK